MGGEFTTHNQKVLKTVSKSPVKDRKRLLVTGQSKLSAGQDFDRGR